MRAPQPNEEPSPGARVHQLAQSGPTVLRILLGGQLRRLREANRISREDAGEAIRASGSKISRLELGRVGFKERDVADLLTLYGVTDPVERDTLLSLARQANAPGWWHHYNDVLPPWFEVYIGLEEAAERLRVHETRFVPELLQTEEYAHAVLRLAHPEAPPAEIARRVSVRMRRQQILRRQDAPQLWALVDETALWRRPGGTEVLRAQLAALREAVQARHITLQVVPMQRGALAAATGPFSLLRFAEPALPDVVYVEQLTSALYLDKPADLAVYKKQLDRLSVQALPPTATSGILTGILEELG
ncbi:helix-turn-helix domain-containing protein [Thermomonospora echinospora]|uniref:helix-turn-helix domain-containing protein n=1 Tax=Thermomonospora echinospora TaxID=1992 RepID=UPI001F2E9FC4|nr:helix-turn-helix transcriptional regulator [Thermomonospora echinospora]